MGIASICAALMVLPENLLRTGWAGVGQIVEVWKRGSGAEKAIFCRSVPVPTVISVTILT